MSGDHPRDADGRISPDPSWPPDRAAPGDLEFLRRFLNTHNRENHADRCGTALGLGEFLQVQGRPGFLPEPDDHHRILAARETLHAMAVAHGRGEPVTPPGASLFDEASVGVAVRADALVPVARGERPADRLLSELARIVLVHAADGTWRRLIACAHCRWVVYDTSRNRGGRWCSMGACGGRQNARAYRRRQATAVRSSGARD